MASIKYLSIVILFILLGLKKEEKYNQFDHVYVEWVDIIQMKSGWHSKEEIDEWLDDEQDTVRQTGFVYKETRTHFVLVDSYFNEDYLGVAIKIPKCNIVKMKIVQ